MAFHIRNSGTEKLARELARRTRTGLTEAVHMALTNELKRQARQIPLWERSVALRRRIAARIKTPEPVGKAFRDSLYEHKTDNVR